MEVADPFNFENDDTQSAETSWLSDGFDFDDSYHLTTESVLSANKIDVDLRKAMTLLGSDELNYCDRIKMIEIYMGSMALCRGERGEELRSAGAIHALIYNLGELSNKISVPLPLNYADSDDKTSLQLATACLGAVRDLCCGSAGNREAFRTTAYGSMDGMELLSMYLTKYDGVCWEELDSSHLKLLTGVVGALRNVTHATSENCVQLHHFGVSKMLIWRLMHGSGSNNLETMVLPASSNRCREAVFRSASTLINMAEKCAECAKLCANEPCVIRLLVESWGGAHKVNPLLHLGLAAVLRCAKEELPLNCFDHSWEEILQKEQRRKVSAQQREEARKLTLM